MKNFIVIARDGVIVEKKPLDKAPRFDAKFTRNGKRYDVVAIASDDRERLHFLKERDESL